MSSFPTPLRAALGLALTVVDTARETATQLPQKAVGLPVAVASQAVQLSLRAQQQYAAYVNKGDELIGTFRGAPAEPPAWATFDEDEPTPARNTAFDRVPDAEDELDDLSALDELEDLAEELAGDLGTGSVTRLDVALDVLDGSYEQADGPRPTPGAPDTVTHEASVEITPDGDEIIGADAPRSTAPREPRKATRKIATKSSRKVAAKKAPPAKKAAKKAAAKAAPTKTAPAKAAAPAKKAPGKKAAKKAAAKKTTPLADLTLEGAPLDDALIPQESLTPPASPDAQVGDTRPSDGSEV